MKLTLLLGFHIFVAVLAFDYYGDNSTSLEHPPCLTEVEEPSGMSRNMKRRTWPKKRVPYKISSSFTASERKIIYDAMTHIQSQSCVRFVPKKWYTWNYVYFKTSGSGCSSTGIGYSLFRRKTKINLSRSGCINLGIVAHEILHALGFEHEQNRPDRNRYVKIQWQNIIQTKRRYRQFIRTRFPRERIRTCKLRRLRAFDNCASRSTTVTHGLPYDYNSIMHYGPYFFARNNKYPTITKRNGQVAGIGPRRSLTPMDFKKLNRVYRCPSGSGTSVPVGPLCKNRYPKFYCKLFRRKCRRSKYRNRCRKTCRAC